jgi:hypothetical protein
VNIPPRAPPEHDREKRVPVFRKNHAPLKICALESGGGFKVAQDIDDQAVAVS